MIGSIEEVEALFFKKSYIMRLPYWYTLYKRGSLIYLGPDYDFDVVRVRYIMRTSDSDQEVYLLERVIWKSLWRRWIGWINEK